MQEKNLSSSTINNAAHFNFYFLLRKIGHFCSPKYSNLMQRRALCLNYVTQNFDFDPPPSPCVTHRNGSLKTPGALRNAKFFLKRVNNVRFPDINTVNEITLIHATTFEFHFALFLIPLLWFGILSLCKLQLYVK